MKQSTTVNCTILVNTSDGFEDCWLPFFTLLRTYWPDCDLPIVLNTQRRRWSFPGLNIRCSAVEEGHPEGEMTWSACLRDCLDQLETPLVLYMQEDYFLERVVRYQLISEFSNVMIQNKDVKHIGLTDHGAMGPFEPTGDERLWQISQRSRYRISTQAALWRVETLRSYLRPQENGWMFEIYGTKRSQRRKEIFLTANRGMHNSDVDPIIQYMHTGIIKGKWHPAVPALFKSHGIEVDFRKRGFFRPKPRIVEKMYTMKKLLADPVGLIRGLRGI